MGIATGAVIGSAIIGGIASNSAAQKGADAARDMANRGVAQWEGITPPEVQDQKISLIAPELVGKLSPEMMQAEKLGPSGMENIQINPGLKQAQMDSLGQLQALAKGGLSPGDIAAYRELQNRAASQAEANRQAVLSNFAQRGALGSGNELAAQLQSQQQSNQELSRNSDVLAQQAQGRALQAISQSGSMAGQMRGQEFGEQADVARAKDIINQFNTANRQNVGNQNVNMQNQAQQANLATQQQLANAKAAMQNQQDMYNKQLLQQRFQNQATLAAGRSGQYNQAANQALQGAAGQAAAIGGLTSGLMNIGAAYAKNGKPVPDNTYTTQVQPPQQDSLGNYGQNSNSSGLDFFGVK